MTTPLTFDNPLKFCLDSYHNAKGRPTFLHQKREREYPKLRANHTHSLRGASNKLHAHESYNHSGWSNEGPWQRRFFHCQDRGQASTTPTSPNPTNLDFNFLLLFLSPIRTPKSPKPKLLLLCSIATLNFLSQSLLLQQNTR